MVVKLSKNLAGFAVAKWSNAHDWELRSRVVHSNPKPC